MSAPRRSPGTYWLILAVTTVLSIQLLVLMEWIFFVTKPSFLAVLGTGRRLLVLGLTPLPLLVLVCGLLLPLALAARLWQNKPGVAGLLGRLGILVPTAVLGALFLLMADNFTNTVLGWSLERSSGFGRVAAVVVVAAAFFLGLRTARAWVRFFSLHPIPGTGLAIACLAISLVILVGGGGGRASPLALNPAEIGNLSNPPPNILLLGGDGLNSTHLSAYGYERATTPYLEELIPYSLFCENSFANCDHTTGSLASILTGRAPTATHVTYPPDILAGDQAYLHLPGLLKRLGYVTEQISIRHYGDAFDVNMREGFDRATFRDRGAAQALPRFVWLAGQEAGLFFETIVDRIAARLAHTAGLSVLPSAYQEAAHAERLTGHTDADRYDGLVEVLRQTPEPFFVHTHFMATHGAHFTPSRNHFSAGQTQDQDWMPDFFDDAILEFDGAVASLVEVLRERGVLNNTLIVIYSDHGMRSDARQRTPLMFIFPEGDRAGRITANVQNLDIAPTIVDYLGLEPPEWMHGRSLLGGPASTPVPVFSTGFRGDILRRVVPAGPFEVDNAVAGPPFFSMGRVSMIVGQRVYSLDLVDPALEVHDLPDHTSPTPETDLPTAEAAGRILVDHLRKRGWDTAELPDPLPGATPY
ncbi:MAG: sulfatase-like hydrolase/transferase [Candidatus Krumholzibacteriota bacterium]